MYRDMNNTSATDLHIIDHSITSIDLALQISGIVLGLLIAVFAFVTILCIVCIREFRKRKELILIALLFFGDFNIGFTNFATSIHQLIFTFTDDGGLITAQACLYYPHTSTGMMGNYFMTSFLFVISVDRLISVISPMRYLQLRKRYMVAVVGTPCCLIALLMVTMWTLNSVSMRHDPYMPRNCAASSPFYPPWFGILARSVQLSLSSASIVVYFVVMIIFWAKPKSEYPSMYELQIRRQRKITKVLALMMLWTLLTFVTPVSCQAWTLYGSGSQYINVVILGYVASRLWAFHSLFNIIIFLARDEEVIGVILKKLLRINFQVESKNNTGTNLLQKGKHSNKVNEYDL